MAVPIFKRKENNIQMFYFFANKSNGKKCQEVTKKSYACMNLSVTLGFLQQHNSCLLIFLEEIISYVQNTQM